MSYDIIIRSDERHASSVSRERLAAYLDAKPNVRGNGSGFLLEVKDRLWMEIDLSFVVLDVEGDMHHGSERNGEINCVDMHIPYAYWNNGVHAEQYLGLCCEIAAFLGWEAYNPQVDECFDQADFLDMRRRRRTAWYPISMAVSPQGAHIIVTTLMSVFAWNLRDGRLEGFWDVSDSSNIALNGAQRVATTERNGTVAIREAHSGSVIHVLAEQGDGWADFVASPGGDLLTISKGGQATQWDVVSGAQISSWKSDEYEMLGTGPAGHIVAARYVGGADSIVGAFLDGRTGKRLHGWSQEDPRISLAVFSADGRFAATGGPDKRLRIWDLSTFTLFYTLKGTGWITCGAFSDDGETLLTGSRNKSVKLWSMATGKAVRTFKGHEEEIRAVGWLPGTQAVVSCSRWSMRCWNVLEGALWAQVAATLTGEWVVRTPDGRYDHSEGFQGIKWTNDARDRFFERPSGDNDLPTPGLLAKVAPEHR